MAAAVREYTARHGQEGELKVTVIVTWDREAAAPTGGATEEADADHATRASLSLEQAEGSLGAVSSSAVPFAAAAEPHSAPTIASVALATASEMVASGEPAARRRSRRRLRRGVAPGPVGRAQVSGLERVRCAWTACVLV